MLIDTHAHLEMPDFDRDLCQVIERARTVGVDNIITIGSDLSSSKKAAEIASSFDNVFAAVGIHPHEAKSVNEQDYDQVREIIKRPKIVAVGEIGLDYFRHLSPREAQRKVFRRQIQMAREEKLPIIVHIRDSYDEALQILEEERDALPGGVIHCFSGGLKEAMRALNSGFYISVAGPLTYPKSEALRMVVREVPMERLLVETDSPYLTPQVRRGKRNEPAFVIEVAKMVAELKGLSLEDVGRITSLNVFRLFGIGNTPDEGKIAYKIRDSLYLNITNRCSNDCAFCIRSITPFIKGHHLILEQEPEAEDIWKAIGDPNPGACHEVVFCGLGEPLIRLDVVKVISTKLKKSNGKVKIRVNSNGQANMLHGRNILIELVGLVDEITVSLNAPDEETYYRICKPQLGQCAYKGIKEFILEAKRYIPQVSVTALNGLPGVDIERCRQIAENELGVKFRVREYNEVG